MQIRSILSFVLTLVVSSLFAQLQSPNDFLPHDLGETFTPHHLLVDYIEHVADNSPNVQLQQYGTTNQDRPLLLATISTPENLARIEAIRENNLRKTGLSTGSVDPALDRGIVWLSYSVHGNEAAGSESAMAVIYELANPNNQQTQAWLENTIVLLDPSLNPDGYSRYTHWYRNVAAKNPDPIVGVREHNEPWPGGRVNHYYFDLNRDWAWQTQKESQHRMKLYRQWMPHIHADVHEQYYDSPYYFAPAAAPYHDYITDWQADFQMEIGKNHAKHFDQEGWLYYTREVFDLLYPSYGDTYPTFNGSIGMTYEQGGHSRAGRAIIMPNHDTLTLSERIEHHKVASLSTVEIASNQSKEIIQQFEDFFDKSQQNPPGRYKTFIIKGSNPTPKLKAFCALLDKNGIQYGKADKTGTFKAFDYQSGQQTNAKLESNDLVISAYQPLAVLTQVLLEPQTGIEDSLTYDITAWSLIYAHGLEAFASSEKVSVKPGYSFPDYSNNLKKEEAPYAYLANWHSLDNARFLGALCKRDIKVRVASTPFTIANKTYDRGTLIITKADNRKKANFNQIVFDLAEAHQQEINTISTGFSDNGKDLGSDAMRFLDVPKIAVLSGDNTSSNQFGQVWHFFEQELNYPIHIFDSEQLSGLPLHEFNLLVMPEGRYRLNDATLEKISDWVGGGGRIIAIGRAVSAFEDKKGFALTQYATDDDKNNAKKEAEAAALANRLNHVDGQERRNITEFIPGAIFKVDLDSSHPLAYGLNDHYFSLKTSTSHYKHLKDVANVGTLGEDLMVLGFAGAKAKEKMQNTSVFAVQHKGRGSITYMIDNPLFRSFWENGKFLFSNAVFFVGQ